MLLLNKEEWGRYSKGVPFYCTLSVEWVTIFIEQLINNCLNQILNFSCNIKNFYEFLTLQNNLLIFAIFMNIVKIPTLNIYKKQNASKDFRSYLTEKLKRCVLNYYAFLPKINLK